MFLIAWFVLRLFGDNLECGRSCPLRTRNVGSGWRAVATCLNRAGLMQESWEAAEGGRQGPTGMLLKCCVCPDVCAGLGPPAASPLSDSGARDRQVLAFTVVWMFLCDFNKTHKKNHIFIPTPTFSQRVCLLSRFSCVQLCDPTDCSPPGSSVHGILQARILEWVAMPCSRGSSQPRDWTCVSYVSLTSRQILYP